MRITGMASGMDIDGMVQQMVDVDRLKVDRVEREKQELEWKQEAYTDLNKDFANFLIDSRKDLGLMRTTSTGTNLNVGSSSINWHMEAISSDESVGTARVSGINAFTGNHTVDVVRMPKGVDLTSTAKIEGWEVPADGVSFELNGKKIELKEGSSLNDLARSINNSNSGVRASYDETLGRLFLQTETTGKDAKIEFSNFTGGAEDVLGKLNLANNGGVKIAEHRYDVDLSSLNFNVDVLTNELEFTIEGKIIKVPIDTNQDDLEDVINEKLKEKGLDYISFKYDNNGNSKFTADRGPISIEVGGEQLTVSEKPDDFNFGSGQSGQVNYNGIDVDIDNPNFSFNGISFTARAKGTFTVTVENNINAAVDKITDFVNKYNDMISKAGELVNQRSDRGFGGFTAEERRAMSDEEIEKWEEKAKQGLMHRDPTITRMLSSIRLSLYDNVAGASGAFKHLTELGITTERYSSGSTGGRLEIDEDKLRKALNTDANGVMSVLFQEGKVEGTGNQKTDSRGIFHRISDNMVDGMKELINRSGTGNEPELFRKVRSNMLIDFTTGASPLVRQGSVSVMDDLKMKLDSEMNRLNAWLFTREDSYYARFTAMETAMHEANSQMQWLMQQTGQMF